jgi:Clostridial hydrophobic W
MSEAVTAEIAAAGAPHAKSIEAPSASDRVAELRVTAHLMTLETGLYCVFPTPGSPDADPRTGLPGVRVTPAPGLAGRPEAVSVTTFREDGWLNGTAALVRVTDGSAQILVSIYQNPRQGPDAAPRLQVLRLSKEPNGAATEQHVVAAAVSAEQPAPTTPVTEPEVMAHIQRVGDVGGMVGDWVGTKGSKNWVEGFGMAPKGALKSEDVEYQGVLGRNWLSPWVEGGKYCGSRGMALPLLGIKVRLKGDAANDFECSYSATFIDGSEVGPVRGGETCEAESLAPLESFQVQILPRAGASSGATAAVKKAPAEVKPKPAAKSKPPAKSPARR